MPPFVAVAYCKICGKKYTGVNYKSETRAKMAATRRANACQSKHLKKKSYSPRKTKPVKSRI
jgi:hypothetical protein